MLGYAAILNAWWRSSGKLSGFFWTMTILTLLAVSFGAATLKAFLCLVLGVPSKNSSAHWEYCYQKLNDIDWLSPPQRAVLLGVAKRMLPCAASAVVLDLALQDLHSALNARSVQPYLRRSVSSVNATPASIQSELGGSTAPAACSSAYGSGA